MAIKKDKINYFINDEAIVNIDLNLSVNLNELGVSLGETEDLISTIARDLHVLLSLSGCFSTISIKPKLIGMVDKSLKLKDTKIEESE